MSDSKTELTGFFRLEAEEVIGSLRAGLSVEAGGAIDQTVVDRLARDVHSLKGAARLVDRFDIGDIAHGMEDELIELRDQQRTPSPDLIESLKERTDEIERLLDAELSTSSEALAAAPSSDPPPAETVAGGETPEIRSPETVAATEPTPRRTEPRSQPQASSAAPEEGVARVSIETLDEISRHAGELVELATVAEEWASRIDRIRRSSRRSHAADPAGDLGPVLEGASRTLSALRPLGRRLRQLTLDASMVGVADVAHRFERVVDIAASELGKEVHFDLRARAARIDRQVLQKLIEPIAHLLRNAVAHGIEPADQRRALGKPVAGLVVLEIENGSAGLRIAVEDDGRGLDGDRIRAAAGRAVEDAGGGADEEGEIAELIFLPGLTTEARASQTAGRGIGLDAVRSAVQQLRGEIAVRSDPGRSCRFELSLPSNIDLLDVFEVRVAGQSILLPMRNVTRVLQVTERDFVEHAGRTALMIDEHPVSAWDLASLLGFRGDATVADRRDVIVVRAGRSEAACVVDAVGGRERVVVKRLPQGLASIGLLGGAVTMGDGRPGFLLDAECLLDGAVGRGSTLQRTRAEPDARPPCVLVVDDSLTSRMLEKSLLDSAGYRTCVASSGFEALECLAEQEFDLAVLDFEMEGMNGIELAQRIRATSENADLPMVMLTSLGSDEDKQRGMAAGMDAYLVKGQFDQNQFLKTVRDLAGDGKGRKSR